MFFEKIQWGVAQLVSSGGLLNRRSWVQVPPPQQDTIRKHTAIFFSLTLGKKEGAVRLSTLSVKGFGVTVA